MFYELTLITRPDLSQKELEEVTFLCEEELKKQEATLKGIEHWGTKTLAYRIGKHRRGTYVFLKIDSKMPLNALEKTLALNSKILRSLTVRVKEFSQEDTPLLQKTT